MGKNSEAKTAPLETTLKEGPVLLRPFRSDDAELLYSAVRDSLDELGRWLPWCHEDYSRKDAKGWVASRADAWQQGEEFTFAIIVQQTGEFVGGCGLNQIDWPSRRANLGYWIRTSACGRGYATIAAKLTARFGAQQLGLERMEIVAAEKNVASQHVAYKAGAIREGIARSRVRARGVQQDAVIYSITRRDILGV